MCVRVRRELSERVERERESCAASSARAMGMGVGWGFGIRRGFVQDVALSRGFREDAIIT